MHTEWSPALVAALAEPFPKELHMNKGKKGAFVSVHHYVKRLNDLVGPHGWSTPEPMAYHSGSKLGLGVGVTILGVTKWNVGDEMEDHGEPDEDGTVRDYGSSSTNSWAQAFKRCCAYGFGLGLYLYDKEFTKQLVAGRAPASQPEPKAVDLVAPKREREVLERYIVEFVGVEGLTPAEKKNLTVAAQLAENDASLSRHVQDGIARLRTMLKKYKPLNPIDDERREQELELGEMANA